MERLSENRASWQKQRFTFDRFEPARDQGYNQLSTLWTTGEQAIADSMLVSVLRHHQNVATCAFIGLGNPKLRELEADYSQTVRARGP